MVPYIYIASGFALTRPLSTAWSNGHTNSCQHCTHHKPAHPDMTQRHLNPSCASPSRAQLFSDHRSPHPFLEILDAA